MNHNMKIFFALLLSSVINYGQVTTNFVTYGSAGNPADGDDNKIQAINFILPENYQGKAAFRIFDADASGNNDAKFGEYNSSFRFSLFKNEYKEEDLVPYEIFSERHKSELIQSIVVANESEFDNIWVTLGQINKSNSDKNYFTLFVEGLEGNDANIFQVFISSDENENIEIPGSLIYSYQPSIRLAPTKDKISLRFFVDENTDEIYLHSFDFDKTKLYFSTILRDDVQLVENNTTKWSKIKFSLNHYEKNNWLALNYGPLNFDYNDVNFKITDMYGNAVAIPMILKNKLKSCIPNIILKTNYLDCNNLEFDLTESSNDCNSKIFFKTSLNNDFISRQEKFNMNFQNAGVYQLNVYAETQSESITKAKIQKFNVRVNSAPYAKAGEDIVVGAGEIICFDAGQSIDYDGIIKSYIWNFGDGSYSYDKITSHSYNTAGVFYVTLKVIDDFSQACNSSTDTIIVTVNSRPIIQTERRIIGAVDEDLIFDASNSSDADGNIVSYLWDFGKLGTDSGAKIKRRFSSPGKYTARLTIKDNSSASNSVNSEEIDIIINYPPIADAGENKFVAVNETVFLNASRSHDVDGSIISYYWDFDDGTYDYGNFVSHSYSKPGAYNVKLTVKDNSEVKNNSSTSSVTIFVNHPPIAKIETEKYLSIKNAVFNASSSYDPDGEILTYEWDFGDYTYGTGKIVSHTYSLPGTYIITLTVRDNSMKSNNTASIREKIIINTPPIADAGRDMIVAPYQNINFSSSSSKDPDGKIASVKWYINDQLFSQDSNFYYLFEQPGIYKVALEVTDDFPKPLSDVDYSVIKVNSSPVAKISGSSVVAPNQEIKLNAYNSYDADGKIILYKWITDQGNIDYGDEIDLRFSEPNIYRIILQVIDDANVQNSLANDTFFVKVNSAPVISLTETIESCKGSVTIDASGTYDPDGDDLSFTWILPGQVEISGSSILNYNFSQRGIIPVLLVVNDLNNVSNSILKKSTLVKINNVPVANAGNDTTICAGDVVLFSAIKSFDADNSNIDYMWEFDDGSTASGSNVIKKYKSGGIFKATLVVKDNSGLECNTSRDEKIIYVSDGPIANAGKNIVACANSAIQFDGSKSSDIDGIVNSYEWDFGDGEKGTGVNPVHIYSTAGTYKVKLTVYGDLSGECDNSDIDEITVTIIDAPLAKFNSPKVAAENQPIVFDASESYSNSGSIVNYEWDFGNGEKAFGKIVQYSFSKSGKYKVRLKVIIDSPSDCNQSLFEKEIIINHKPLAEITAKSAGAINEIINFSASNSKDVDGKIIRYEWDLGDGSFAEGIEINHIYNAAGTYYPNLKVIDNSSAENNYDTKEFSIKINSSPVADFSIQGNIPVNSQIILDASSSYDLDGMIQNYTWLINDKIISSEKSFIYSFSKVGFYKVKLIVTDDSGQINSKSEIVRTVTVY